MNIYMAPMEGVTNYAFRKIYIKHFTGVDKFFTPFITPHFKKGFSKSERMEIDKEYNKGQNLIPQILTNNADDFLKLANEISEMGYDEFNINLGCPSGTVTSKKRGSGFLQDPTSLDNFFYEIFEKKQNIKISIKTRIGYDNYDEWEELVSVYKKYDFSEIIIHPRRRSDFYKNNVYLPAFKYAINNFNQIPVYNGDINSLSDYNYICEEIFQKDLKCEEGNIMIGRGLVKNPLLPYSIKNACEHYDIKRITVFVDDLKNEYLSLEFGERNTLFKIKEIWRLIFEGREEYSKILKGIRKANNISDYNALIREISRS